MDSGYMDFAVRLKKAAEKVPDKAGSGPQALKRWLIFQ